MVDVVDINTVNMLAMQIAGIDKAISILENDGRITMMTVSTAQDAMPGDFVNIDSSFLTLSAEVIDALIAQLQEERARIASQMSGMGVSV